MEFLRENILKILTMIVVFVIVIIIFTVACGSNNGIRKAKTYKDIENNLVTATKKYLESNKDLLPKVDGKITKVNIDTLINKNLIKEQVAIEDENVKCSGYTEVINKQGEYNYVPYIKCGKYYETKTIAEYIIDNQDIVTTNDGLYKFGETYVFRGENPNNYLKLGNRLYRIMEINENSELKLISTERYSENFTWDDRYNVEKNKAYGINDYSKSRLKDNLEIMLNDTEFFSTQELQKIVEHDICIGKRNPNDFNKTMTEECSNKYPNQKVGLILAAEYSRVSTDTNCNSLNSLSCQNYNYLNSVSQLFTTMTGSSTDTYNVIMISKGVITLSRASRNFRVYPVVYIDRLSVYSSGEGTLENPYIVR